jgi:hypothetical protein
MRGLSPRHTQRTGRGSELGRMSTIRLERRPTCRGPRPVAAATRNSTGVGSPTGAETAPSSASAASTMDQPSGPAAAIPLRNAAAGMARKIPPLVENSTATPPAKAARAPGGSGGHVTRTASTLARP